MVDVALRLRPLICALGLIATGCAERQAELNGDALERAPVCMAIGGTMGYWPDGTHTSVLDVDTGTAVTGCLCMTQEEFESQLRLEELNALTYEQCELHAERSGFAWNSCAEDRDAGLWLLNTSWGLGELAWQNKDGLDCAGEGEALACALSDSRGALAPSLLGLLLLASMVARPRRRPGPGPRRSGSRPRA